MDPRKFMAGGGFHTLALRTDGTLWSWGNNSQGQLGDGTLVDRHAPTQVTAIDPPVDIDASQDLSVALGPDGFVRAWGSCARFAPGTGLTTNVSQTAPARLPKIRHPHAIVAGKDGLLALYKEYVYECWTPPYINQPPAGLGLWFNPGILFHRIAGVDQVVAASCGIWFRLALRQSAPWVLAWGSNNFGQLGDGTTQDRAIPGPVGIPEKIAAISAGSSHAMALDTSGQVWTWGWNKFGQIGNGTSSATVFQTQPVRVPDLTRIKAIAAGAAFCLALRDDHRMLAWGDNSDGQLGDGTTTMRTKPTLLDQPRRIDAIAAGFFHSLAVDRDRRLWTWGRNDFGQLGDGTTAGRPVPAQIGFGNVGFP